MLSFNYEYLMYFVFVVKIRLRKNFEVIFIFGYLKGLFLSSVLDGVVCLLQVKMAS